MEENVRMWSINLQLGDTGEIDMNETMIKNK